jgi:HEAT repeat protein/Na+/melibiose symporter-like transporter
MLIWLSPQDGTIQTVEAPPADNQLTDTEKIEKLPWSIATNSANTVFVQFTFFGSAFVLFLSALNFSKSQVGMQLSLLQFSSIAALFVVPLVARIGYKRAYLWAFGLRTLATAGLLLVPLILPRAVFWYVTTIIALFALLRSIGITAFFPWAQEYVPDAIRGRFSANNNLITSLIGFIAVAVAGTVIDLIPGLDGYYMLFAVATVFGVLALWTAGYRPGGAPAAGGQTRTTLREYRDAAQDPEFKRYLMGVGLITLAILPLGAFVPLYLSELIGIDTGRVVYIQTGVLIGSMVSTTFWGWAADRYGSRPVMLIGTLIWAGLPVAWLLMPRNPTVGFYVALVIAFAQGAANMGWLIGGRRLLYNRIVPPAKKTGYLAIYTAWVGVAGGLSLLLGGWVIELSAGVSGQFLLLNLDAYTALFGLGLGLIILSILMLRSIRGDAQVSLNEFAVLFLRGNPFAAVTSMIRYHLAAEERETIESTARLAETRSPLVVEELLELLVDPRFAVRMEAVISISHMRPDPRLTQALSELLPGTELALSAMAAWALGRLGDPAAIPALREGLNSPYHSIQGQSARALGALGDQASAELILKRHRQEQDKGLAMAYAAALGKLQFVEAVPDLLAALNSTANQGARFELALSLARMTGEEGRFVDLLQQSRTEMGSSTALAQKVNALNKSLGEQLSDEQQAAFSKVGSVLAQGELLTGSQLFESFLAELDMSDLPSPTRQILTACAAHFEQSPPVQIEFVMLALHTLGNLA